MQFVLYTDNLADISIDEACRAAKQAGFDGVDITLRPGGHVLPESVEMGLANARQSADQAGAAIAMATTSITDTSSPYCEDILASCAHYDVRKIKLGYWRYEPFGTLVKQLHAARESLKRITNLAGKYDVMPCVHVHSGDILANGGANLYLILQEFAPDEVGAYVDPMHMTVEGGLSGWEMGLDLLAPWIKLVGMKNFHWIENGREDHGQLRFRPQYTPLSEGQAPLPEFMARLTQLGYDGVVSLHSEYKGQSSFKQLSTPELLAQSAADLKYLKSLVPSG